MAIQQFPPDPISVFDVNKKKYRPAMKKVLEEQLKPFSKAVGSSSYFIIRSDANYIYACMSDNYIRKFNKITMEEIAMSASYNRFLDFDVDGGFIYAVIQDPTNSSYLNTIKINTTTMATTATGGQFGTNGYVSCAFNATHLLVGCGVSPNMQYSLHKIRKSDNFYEGFSPNINISAAITGIKITCDSTYIYARANTGTGTINGIVRRTDIATLNTTIAASQTLTGLNAIVNEQMAASNSYVFVNASYTSGTTVRYSKDLATMTIIPAYINKVIGIVVKNEVLYIMGTDEFNSNLTRICAVDPATLELIAMSTTNLQIASPMGINVDDSGNIFCGTFQAVGPLTYARIALLRSINTIFSYEEV